MISFKKIRTAFLLATLLLIVVPSIVSAHANLVRSEPAYNATLADPPQEIRLWFDEPISPEFSSAQVLDINGQPIEAVTIRVEDSETGLLILTLPELSPGLYSVRWRVLSETDGHFTQGPLVFGVGQATNLDPVPLQAVPAPSLPWPEVLLRGFNFAALMGLVGSVAVAYLVLTPVAAPATTKNEVDEVIAMIRRVARRRVLGWSRWCAGAALVAGIGLLIWQIITLVETLPAGASVWGAGQQLLGQTRWGILWLVRQGILLVLLGVVVWLHAQSAKPKPLNNRRLKLALPVASLLFMLLLFVQSLTSHAAGLAKNTTLAMVADTLHLLAASIWVGGLLALTIGLLPLLRRNNADFKTLTRASWHPFSQLAALGVGLLLVTGLYSMSRQVASLDALITTVYGQVLMGKIGLMLAVGVCGLFNSMLLHPHLAAPLARVFGRPTGWTPLKLSRLPSLVLVEMSLGLVVLFATGLITTTPPARGPEFDVAPEQIPTVLSQTIDDMVVSFAASPNRPGQNVFTVRAVSTRRPAPAEIIRLIVRFTFLGEEMGRTSVDAVEIEPGLYQAGGSYLSLAGPWQVQVVVRRDGIEDTTADFAWMVAPPGEPRPVLLSNRPLKPVLIVAAITLIIVIIMGGMTWQLRHLFANTFHARSSINKFKRSFKYADKFTLSANSNSAASTVTRPK